MAERCRHLGQRRIDRRKRRACRDHQKRRGDKRLRDHDRRDRVVQAAARQAPDQRVGTDDRDQQDSAHQRRQRQRQRHRNPDGVPDAATRLRQPPGQWNSKQRDDRGRDAGRLKRGDKRTAEPGGCEAGSGALTEMDEQHDDRRKQVEREQPAERRQRPGATAKSARPPAPQRPRLPAGEAHRLSLIVPAKVAGTPRPTAAGARSTARPPARSRARPAGPRRKRTNAIAVR